MDLSKLTQQDKDEEVKVKILLEMSTKKYNMQKELGSLKVKLSVKESELEKLKRKVVSLELEVPVIEKQEEIMKEIAENSLRQFLNESNNAEKIQERVWAKINNFVSEASAKLEKRETHFTTIQDAKKCREGKLRQLKLEGEIEAIQSYEKYQAAKIEELKLIKNLLEDDSFVI